MQKLYNPYQNMDGYNCFGCAGGNDIGLKLEFYLDGEQIVSYWEPREEFQGYGDVIHGGILGTLLDEIGAWAVMVLSGTAGVTREMTVRYLKPARTSKGKLTLRARVLKQEKDNTRIRGEILSSSGTLTTEADIDYFLFPLHIARKRLNYPGLETFIRTPEQ